MSVLPDQLRDLITAGPMAHLTTINADGSPQVSVIWVGLDGEEPVSGHLGPRLKLQNIERDPRVVLSFDAPRKPGVFLNPYAVLHAAPRSSPAITRGTSSTGWPRSTCPRTPSSPHRKGPGTSCGTRSSGSEESARG